MARRRHGLEPASVNFTRGIKRNPCEELNLLQRFVTNTKKVAELLGLTEGNVKVRLHRARTAPKKLVEPLLRKEFGS
jgi:hypothetical protein